MKRAYMQTVREPKMSLWQSAAYQVARDKHTGKTREQLIHTGLADPMVLGASMHVNAHEANTMLQVPSAPGKAALTTNHHADLSQLFFDYAEALRRGDQANADALLAEAKRKYSESDLSGWASCVTVYLKYYMGGVKGPIYRSWQQEGAGDIDWGMLPWTLADDAKVGIVGDWGTGMADAKALVKRMITQLEVDAIIHLGDIYYSGTPDECDLHVLGLFDEVFKELGCEPIPVMTIPGNHDYYARGEGFYPLVDKLRGATKSGQVASFFGLRTEDGKWQILAGDTGLEDRKPQDQFNPLAQGPGLKASEVKWHHDKLSKFGGRTVLLTHHQLFSPHSKINGEATDTDHYVNEKLLDIFQPYFDRISGWIWGHEHSYALYQEGLFGLARGRLVGNGGYEIEESEDPYKVNETGLPLSANSRELSIYDGFYNHGCAVLDFERAQPDDDIEARYYQFLSWGAEAPKQEPALELLNTEPFGWPKTDRWLSDAPVAGIGSPKTNDSMRAVNCNGGLLTVYKGAHSNNLYWATQRGTTWRGNKKLSVGAGSNYNPGMAVFNGKVYIAYKGAHSNDLYVAWCDASKPNANQWSGNKRIKDISKISPKSNASPQLVSFNGQLLMMYKGAYTNDLYVATFDGKSWSGNKRIEEISDIAPESNYAPGLVVFDNKVYAIYKGAHSNTMYWMTFNGGQWKGNTKIEDDTGFSFQTNYNPQPQVYQGRLNLLYKGAHSNHLYWAQYDGQSWSGNVRVCDSSKLDPKSPFEPALVDVGERLVGVYPATSNGALYQVVYGPTAQ